MALSGIYFHIPFCSKACSYCDFHFSTSFTLKEDILKAMRRELEIRLKQENLTEINSIYFGGGTPSILSAAEIEFLIEPLREKFGQNESEFTLEANPDDLSPQKLKDFHSIGINRLSIGIQSFFEEDLRWMNRSHNAEQALKCLEDAAAAGFKSFNGDLIFGYPLLSDEKLEFNLNKMLELGVNHLSTYSMTVEEGTALEFSIRKKKEKPMEEGQAERQYRFIMQFLKKNGWEHYEVSNFCKPGNPSLHNSSYWSGKPYLGIGPSAHGYNGAERYWNLANNAGYLKKMEEGILPDEKETLSATDRYNEYLMTRLRTAKGIQEQEMDELFGQGKFDQLIHQIQSPELHHYFQMEENNVRLNEDGFLLADHLISELFVLEADH